MAQNILEVKNKICTSWLKIPSWLSSTVANIIILAHQSCSQWLSSKSFSFHLNNVSLAPKRLRLFFLLERSAAPKLRYRDINLSAQVKTQKSRIKCYLSLSSNRNYHGHLSTIIAWETRRPLFDIYLKRNVSYTEKFAAKLSGRQTELKERSSRCRTRCRLSSYEMRITRSIFFLYLFLKTSAWCFSF